MNLSHVLYSLFAGTSFPCSAYTAVMPGNLLKLRCQAIGYSKIKPRRGPGRIQIRNQSHFSYVVIMLLSFPSFFLNLNPGSHALLFPHEALTIILTLWSSITSRVFPKGMRHLLTFILAPVFSANSVPTRN